MWHEDWKIWFEDDDDEDANLITKIKTKTMAEMRFHHMKHQTKTGVKSVSRPDEAEGQRQNLTYSDLSKLSLGRMKQRICTDVNDIRSLWIREQVTLRHFVSSKVSTLLNRADNLTKQ